MACGVFDFGAEHPPTTWCVRHRICARRGIRSLRISESTPARTGQWTGGALAKTGLLEVMKCRSCWSRITRRLRTAGRADGSKQDRPAGESARGRRAPRSSGTFAPLSGRPAGRRGRSQSSSARCAAPYPRAAERCPSPKSARGRAGSCRPLLDDQVVVHRHAERLGGPLTMFPAMPMSALEGGGIALWHVIGLIAAHQRFHFNRGRLHGTHFGPARSRAETRSGVLCWGKAVSGLSQSGNDVATRRRGIISSSKGATAQCFDPNI